MIGADSCNQFNRFSRSSTISQELLALALILQYRWWYDVPLPRFIPRNLKRNRNVCLIYIKFGSVIFVDTLTTIFSCIRKFNKKSSEVAAIRKNLLLKVFSIFHSVDIPSYNNCIIRRIQSYRTFPQDTFRYEEYILYNCSDYNILNVSNKQLFHFASQYTKLENKVQMATEKLLRL